MTQAVCWRATVAGIVLSGVVASATNSGAAIQKVQPPSAATNVVVGRVVEAHGGAAIPDAVVELQLGVRIASATTDASGSFRLDSVPTGTFSLSARASGYVPRSLARARPESRAVSVVVAGGAVLPIEVRLFRLASLRGRVLDASGEPVTGVIVRALRPAMRDGPPLGPVPQGRSDDRGRYTLSGLEPGAWIVAVPFTTVSESPGGQPVRLVNGLPQSLLRIGDVGVRATNTASSSAAVVAVEGKEVLIRRSAFFRQATNIGSAEFMIIHAGETRDDLDFILDQTQGRIVSGRLVAPPGAPANVTVSLRDAEGSDLLVDSTFDVASTSAMAPGEFVLAGVPPGRYVLHVDAVAGGSRGRSPDDTHSQHGGLFAREPVNVGAQDLSDLTILLRSGLSVSGRIVWDGVPPKLSSAVTLRMTDLSPSPSGLRRSQVATTVSESGAFHVTGLLPGVYSFFVPAPPPWRVGLIRVGPGSAGVRPIEITTDLTDVELVLTSRFGTVTATVRSPDTRQADMPLHVLLFSAERATWADAYLDSLRFRDEAAMPGDTVTFADLPVGDYLLAIVDDRRFDPRWRRPAMLASMTVRAVRATVSNRQTVPVTLTFPDAR